MKYAAKVPEAASGLAAVTAPSPTICPDNPAPVMPWEWPPSLSGGSSGPFRKETEKPFALVLMPTPHQGQRELPLRSHNIPDVPVEEIMAHLLANGSHPNCLIWGRGEAVTQGRSRAPFLEPRRSSLLPGVKLWTSALEGEPPCPTCNRPEACPSGIAGTLSGIAFPGRDCSSPAGWVFPLILPLPVSCLPPPPPSPLLCLPFHSSIFLSFLLLLISFFFFCFPFPSLCGPSPNAS